VFRAQDHGAREKNIYLRATNGRADDQSAATLHAVRVDTRPSLASSPEGEPWRVESYVDLEAGAWTKMKIVVPERKRSSIERREPACLIVN